MIMNIPGTCRDILLDKGERQNKQKPWITLVYINTGKAASLYICPVILTPHAAQEVILLEEGAHQTIGAGWHGLS